MGFNQAVSGLRTAAENLDVIGNNVANSQTIGYRNADARFADMISVAGVGMGAERTAISRNFNQGSISSTGNELDLAIENNGMLIFADADGRQVYSRNGELKTDPNGYVINEQGRRLQVFGPTGNGELVDLRMPPKRMAPAPTTKLELRGNLKADEPIIAVPFDQNDKDTYSYVQRVPAFDSLGNEHQIDVYYRHTGASQWQAMVPDANGQFVAIDLVFDAQGKLTAGGQFNLTLNPPGAAPINVAVDESGLTQYARNDSAIGVVSNDGYPT